MDDDLRNAWADFLQKTPWDYFITATFRDPLPQHRVATSLRSVGKTLKRYKPGAVFLGAEQHESHFYHIHGLYRQGLVNVPASFLWQDLFTTYGRAKVEIIRSVDDVSAYCTKYVTKKLADYDIF